MLAEKKKILKFVNKSPNSNPSYAHPYDSGFDLRSWIDDTYNGAVFDKEKVTWYITIHPGEIKLIETGLYFDIPNDCEIQIRPRSGYSLKVGLTINNSPATIDSPYIGSIGLICLNPTNEPIKVYNNTKIAQGVLCPVYNESMVQLEEVDEIKKESERGSDGYGSSGM